MNLRTLSDEELLSNTKALAQKERELLTQVLNHLREVEVRRLYAKLKFKSLFDYAVKELGYSADQAGRRIAAMRLLRQLPEIEAKVESGALNLTHLSLAQAAFRKEEPTADERLSVLQAMEHKSTREAEKILLARSADSQPPRPDRVRAVGADRVEFRFTADERLAEKLERVKGLLAHTPGSGTMAELVEKLCDIALARTDKGAAPATARRTPAAPKGPRVKKPRAIPASVRRHVWSRAQSRCENCGSYHALQVDHVQPVAMSGGDELENLRLLCRSCNARHAIETLGLERMRGHLDRRQ